MVRIISGSIGELIGPGVDDRMAIDVVDGGHTASLKFVLSSHSDVTQDGAGKLGEEALDEVEPGAVLWRERKVEAACRLCVEPGSGFPRDVCGMIVEDQLDRGGGQIRGIAPL